MSIVISIGKSGGFYWFSGYSKRICLGRVSFTFLPADLDEYFSQNIPRNKK